MRGGLETMSEFGTSAGKTAHAMKARRPDLICLSHLRWNFVFQRPQHLLTRCARGRRVFFVEEPVRGDGPSRLDVTRESDTGVHVVVPHLPHDLGEAESRHAQRDLIGELMRRHTIADYVLWYYTPMALPFTQHLAPAAVVYDCMDELSAFAGAPQALRDREAELMRRADVVFTGGYSLYEAKRGLHPNIHPFPSSVDVAHFAQARGKIADPPDQAAIPGPRLGFFGVIDERLDIELVDGVAALRPGWQIVLIGPVVKIDPASLPRRPNIHYLGQKSYGELPAYLAGWDVALVPFARNQATRYISPTKTPEYLAAGRPVVSTSIRDVVRPYGELGLARIADAPADFVAAVEACLEDRWDLRLPEVDRFLAQTSWDGTWARIEALLDAAGARRRGAVESGHV
jgi:glycosyltransferase involved in cell wall biosynthesis